MTTPAAPIAVPMRQCSSSQHEGNPWLPLTAFPLWTAGRRRVVCAACLWRMDPARVAAEAEAEARRVAEQAEREHQEEMRRREALAARIKEWIDEQVADVRRWVPDDWIASSTSARMMASLMVRYAEELGPLDRGGDLGHPEVLHDLKMVKALVEILIRAGEYQAEQSRAYLQRKQARMAATQEQTQVRVTVALSASMGRREHRSAERDTQDNGKD